MAKTYNALFRVAFSGGAYEPESAIFTEIASGEEEIRNKIYASSNWVVFVDPKVDLSFFKEQEDDDQELMIIH
jgi:DNA phosphorothioation-dependent restriction protein DptH